ncbi:MAG: arsenite methyltransferase [Chloroflexi bacterium]|nr:arsenite methyltransferase [Chloroflexota bacterium]
MKQAVRERYAGAISEQGRGCCGAPSSCAPTTPARNQRHLAAYAPEELAQLPADAVEHSFGCGNPLSFAGVRPGDVVLDIGSGAGIDVLLASKIVGETGKVIGLDFTSEMIERGRENAAKAGVKNVEFRLGDAEAMPAEDASVDWIISNCVINLAPDKRKVFGEVFRVLKPGGRVSISDIVTAELPDDVRNDIALWTGCIAGAIEEDEYLRVMREAGLVDVQVIARQRYDEASVRSFLQSAELGLTDRQDLAKLLERGEGFFNRIWSAKIVGRKPA